MKQKMNINAIHKLCRWFYEGEFRSSILDYIGSIHMHNKISQSCGCSQLSQLFRLNSKFFIFMLSPNDRRKLNFMEMCFYY